MPNLRIGRKKSQQQQQQQQQAPQITNNGSCLFALGARSGPPWDDGKWFNSKRMTRFFVLLVLYGVIFQYSLLSHNPKHIHQQRHRNFDNPVIVPPSTSRSHSVFNTTTSNSNINAADYYKSSNKGQASSTSATSFKVQINETLEMERNHIFFELDANLTNEKGFPIRTIFMKNYIPLPPTKFLLDYVVAGFAKCGTTTLGHWLGNHPEVRSPTGEIYYYGLKTSRMMMEIFSLKKNSAKVPMSPSLNSSAVLGQQPQPQKHPIDIKKVGFRCPHHVQSPKGLMLLREPYFSEAKIIVSVRHPVIWFESYYNYRLEGGKAGLLKGAPNELIGHLKCKGCNAMWILSTAKGAFHWYLSKLKKTPLNSQQERDLLQPFGKQQNQEKRSLQDGREEDGDGQPKSGNNGTGSNSQSSNKVFFIEIRQLGDSDPMRTQIFRNDMQEFLQLKQPLDPMIKVLPGKPKKEDEKKTTVTAKNFTRLDICQDEYLPVRTELMYISRNASIWFRQYFMKSSDVYVSSPGYMVQLLEEWMTDPCSLRKAS